MKTRSYLIHALSALHSGTGHAAGAIDLPIARMAATGIPYVPGTSVKGVLREARRGDGDERERWLAVFGPETDEAHAHAGALVVGEARLLALPVRSFFGTFAWVTSPLLLYLASRDLPWPDLPVPEVEGGKAAVGPGTHKCVEGGAIYLEDLDLEVAASREAGEAVRAWGERLRDYVSPGPDYFSQRFVVVDDDTMAYLWDTATQVDAHIRIDRDTGTVDEGALWLEESLPAETVLVGLVGAERARRRGVQMTADEVLDFAVGSQPVVLQFGGHATTGKGRCRLVPVVAGGAG
ncbi:MAG: type III-B CRISPR module RAMP protein Cmr4 [Clostridia bacterium]|nr:type III-B CRISPR module RAMP protein Cmr4 [Clostridia bacterium]